MAYQAWSVVFGEQPSAAKWNILGTNDASFNSLLGTYGVNNPYCFRAYASGTTTLTDGNYVKISFATEEYDYNNNFASSTYTTPIAGVYHFDALVTHASGSSTPVEALTVLYKNGSAAAWGQDGKADTTVASGFGVSTDLLLAANDTIEVYHYQNSAGNELATNDQIKTYFGGHLVHAT